MNRVLLLGVKEKLMIRELVNLATDEPYSLADIQQMAEGFDPNNAATRRERIDSKFTIDLPVGVRVTYTHEMQPIGLCRHMSVSVHPPEEGNYPSIALITLLMAEFGFLPLEADRTSIWLEKYEAGFGAVNVLEPVEE